MSALQAAVLCAMTLAAPAPLPRTTPDDRPVGTAPQSSTRAYSGIHVVDRDGALVVWSILPGPLDGAHTTSATLQRGDVLVSIDGAAATRAAWDAAHAAPPGTELTLGVRAAKETSSQIREVRVLLEDESTWRGLLGRGELPPLPARLAAPAPTALDDEYAQALAALGPEARARVARLEASLARRPEREGDPSTPPLLRALLARPGAAESLVLDGLPSGDDWRAAPFRSSARLVAHLAGEAAPTLPEPHGRFAIQHPDAGIWYLDFLLNEARVQFSAQVSSDAARAPGLRALVVERLDELIVRGPNSRAAFEALRGMPSLTALEAASIVAHFEVVPELSPEVAGSEPAALPEALAGAVDGAILAASEIPELGWLVVGGAGPNRYDLGRVAAVLDLGGDDRFEWRGAPAAHRLVVDLAGDDTHALADGGGAAGPAAAIGAMAVIDDHAGNDRYEGGALAAGASLGISLLVDRDGHDRYQGGAWSLGAAAGGAALVVDLAGNDEFAAEGLALGVGGPSGVGAVVDLAGDDAATLGTRPSLYGIEGEHVGFGMGLGFGFRLVAAGGVGAFLDFAGDDRRRSGEFSQGCGHFLGLGILLDAGGNDTAHAGRYGLGASLHQAGGIALDLAGNDRYHGRTAVHLGGAWDESVAVFVDRSGDDLYESAMLSLGGAAQQALALSVDRAGRDRRTAGTASLGGVLANEYHFAATGLGSFAALLDLAGVDAYPEGRGDDRTIVTPEAATAELRGQDAAFVDRQSIAAPAPEGEGSGRTGSK